MYLLSATVAVEYMQTGVDVFRAFVNGWYNGTLFKIFFAEDPKGDMLKKICSVLAGYVWDETNPFVRKSERSVKVLADYLDRQQGKNAS